MDKDQIALVELLNRVAAEKPTCRWLQELRDNLSTEADEMLRVMIEVTQPKA